MPLLQQQLLFGQVNLTIVQHLVEPNPNTLGLNCFPNYRDFVWLLFGCCSHGYILYIHHWFVWVFSSTERWVLAEGKAKKPKLCPHLNGFSSACAGRVRFVSLCPLGMPRMPALQTSGTRQTISAIYHSCCFIVSGNRETWFCKCLLLILDPCLSSLKADLGNLFQSVMKYWVILKL